MRKFLLFLVLLLIIAGIGGFFALGLFPPPAHQTEMTVAVPSSRITAPAAAPAATAAPAH